MTEEQKEARRQLWKERVAAFKDSGQSARAWCNDHGLKEHQLRYWLEKYGPQKVEPVSKWISVDMKEKPVQKDCVITVKVDQAIIEVKPGFDPVLLREVIQALRC